MPPVIPVLRLNATVSHLMLEKRQYATPITKKDGAIQVSHKAASELNQEAIIKAATVARIPRRNWCERIGTA
jgi:hypothetical protein